MLDTIEQEAHETYERFVALAGIDSQQGNNGTARVEVVIDGRRVHRSPLLRGGGDPHALEIEIPHGAKEIILIVTDGGDGKEWDLVNWVDAGFRM